MEKYSSNERACGCIPFRRSTTRELEALLVKKRRAGFWEFPKGKVEDGETEEETALRELREETGLTGVLSPEQPFVYSYDIVRDGQKKRKTVKLYLCRVQDGAYVVLDPEELSEFLWAPLDELECYATYTEVKEAARYALHTLAD